MDLDYLIGVLHMEKIPKDKKIMILSKVYGEERTRRLALLLTEWGYTNISRGAIAGLDYIDKMDIKRGLMKAEFIVSVGEDITRRLQTFYHISDNQTLVQLSKYNYGSLEEQLEGYIIK